jgi:hypothetical protein
METAVAKNKQELQSYSLAQPNDVISMAVQLKKFITEQKLVSRIQGKDFVNVEGWQFAGAMLGIVPVIEYSKNISTSADEFKYEAMVTLVNLQTDKTVGRGIAICSNKETTKKSYAEYAISSMAQTRAIGKAYRNVLAFVMRAAGFEPTPAEEMDEVKNEAGTSAEIVKSEPEKLKEDKNYIALRAEFLRLLNNGAVLEEERKVAMLNVNKHSESELEKRIAKLNKLIEERTSKAA